MAVYYKFKSAKDYDSVPLEGHFISVGNLKEKIFELKHLGRGTDFDLVVTNAQTNEEYLDEAMLIPKNTSVLIRRVPGRPRMTIVTAPVTELQETNLGNNPDDVQAVKGSFAGADPSGIKYAEDTEWDEFGTDLYAIPETISVQSSIPVQDAPPVNKEDEESKIKALIDTPALDWQHQPSDGFGPGRGFGRGMGGRMMGGRGFGRGGFEKKTPPPGYICHRCKVPGHFIQHCPTNGDPNFDIKRVKPPTGIPKSMLVATPDGSYALPSGAVAVLKPNEAAFEKEIEGMPSTRPVGDLPPELHCPLCKEVMKDAVLTSKCCFTSFCDKCIRDYIISKSMCVCGATSILADDLLPNKTLRDTINRILESNNTSAENGGSAFQVQDMESRNPQAKVPSPTQSAASKGQREPTPPPQKEESPKVAEIPKAVETVEENKSCNVAPVEQEKGKALRLPDVSEATHDSKNIREAASQGSAQFVDEEVQQRPVSGEAGKKKKKKKVRMPLSAAEMQWRNPQELVPENYMMPMGPSAAFNPYWNGMQPGFDGFMPPYPGPMPYMGYGLNPMDMAFGGVMPHDPFGGPGCMMPPYGGPPQRDLAELAMGFNAGPPPIMSREEFEARKADLKRKREMDRRGEREMPKDREYGREGSSTVDAPPKSKSRPLPPPPIAADQRRRSPDRRSDPRRSPDRRSDIPRPSSKKKSDSHEDDRHHHRSDRLEYPDEPHRDRDRHRDRDHHHRSSYQRRSESPAEPPAPPSSAAAAAAADKKKGSVFSRISFPENDSSTSKKRKTSEAPPASGHRSAPVPSPLSNGHHDDHKAAGSGSSRRAAATATAAAAAAAIGGDDSSDDERHFKRRPSRYNSSPPAAEEEHHRRSREKERERERERGGGYGTSSKHR